MTTAITPNVPSHASLSPLASRMVDVDALPWQATRYPGIEIKTLLFDRASGLASSVMRMAPGSVLPEHEHVRIEQTWVIEGHLVDKSGPDEGIECQGRPVHLAPRRQPPQRMVTQGRVDAGLLSNTQQVLCARRQRHRHGRHGLASDLGCRERLVFGSFSI